ncbi:SMEK domain-containing protein [Rhizobium leguminosarum]|uniref:SMEK domain-containing protein n=1 Tax=Rhizobium leguminosarum TaxID=384 RepID=UPI001C90D27B|nr:SMEK domain-containing protein [Rhizobium leguminosarum]MBY2941845.1 SMEK domain-containing protein [Rhizobium leguminosarum]
MLTRGYFIGEIVDALTDIGVQVLTRGRLGLLELNRYAEDFFKTVLNDLLSLSLRNLNQDRVNAPGLDLADDVAGVAFQITADKSSAKVNDMLRKLSASQVSKYSTIYMLVISGKQGSYSLDKKQCAKANFKEKNIWDMDDLCKLCMDLPLETLHRLYAYVRAEVTKVKIDLEIPDSDGIYPTNISDYIEALPKPRFSKSRLFNSHLKKAGYEEKRASTLATLQKFSNDLSKLPRMTREFFVVMIERRERDERRRLGEDAHIKINFDALERIASRHPDLKGELRLLQNYDFASLDEATDFDQSSHWILKIPGVSSDYLVELVKFAETNNVSLSKALVSLDFGQF